MVDTIVVAVGAGIMDAVAVVEDTLFDYSASCARELQEHGRE